MSSSPDLLILGGGVIGLTAAYFLAKEGVRVEIVDKGDFGREASWAGAGILPPGNPARARTPLDQLRAHSAQIYPRLSEELRQETGIDNGYLVCGGLELLEADHQEALNEWRQEGIAVEERDEKSLPGCEPALAKGVSKAFFLPGMAQVRNPRHVKALLAGCEKNGVRLRSGCPVYGFERQGQRITAIKTGVGPLAAGKFLVATGAWTDALMEQVGCRLGIHPVRGQIAMLNTGTPLLSRIILQGKRYLVPRPDGPVLVGSTEEDAGFDKRTTAGAINGLLEFAIRLVPGLVEAHVERSWAGLRPGSPDGMPFLGQVPGFTNLFIAAGHFRAGIQLSPATGLIMKELLLGQKLTQSLAPFRLDRQPASPQRMAFRS